MAESITPSNSLAQPLEETVVHELSMKHDGSVSETVIFGAHLTSGDRELIDYYLISPPPPTLRDGRFALPAETQDYTNLRLNAPVIGDTKQSA